jgi:hypothetical protein
MRENLKYLEGKPVLMLGDLTSQKSQNLELITSVQVLFPKLQKVVGICQVVEDLRKTDHMWVPHSCRIGNGWWGYIDQYQRKDGKINWALRPAQGELEEKHLKMRLMVNAYGRFLKSLNGSTYISNSNLQLVAGIVLQAEELFKSKDTSKWKDLAFQALDPNFVAAFNIMISDLLIVHLNQQFLRKKRKKIKIKSQKGFAF